MLEKTNLRISLFLTVFLTVLSLNSTGQGIPLSNKTLLLNAGKKALSDTIIKRTQIEYPFIIGRNHNQIFDKASHPYFNENEWQKGSLVFNGITYTAEILKYDIETDNLIYLLVANNSLVNVIALDENAITEFNLSNKTFRYFKNIKNERGKGVKDGYYEVAFDGKLKFLNRREKKQTISNNYLKYDNASVSMYLLQGDKLVAINSMSKLTNQLSGQYRDAVKRYVKANHFKISKTKYASASYVLEFYENFKEQ